MNIGKTLFAQIMDFIPWTSFTRIVNRYGGDARSSSFACTAHFRVMAYAQLTWRESLRDIGVCVQTALPLFCKGFFQNLSVQLDIGIHLL